MPGSRYRLSGTAPAPTERSSVEVMWYLSENPGKETLLRLRGLGGDGTPLLRLSRSGSLRFGGDRLALNSAIRQGKMLLQRTDEHIRFALSLGQGIDEFNLFGE